MEEGQTIYCHTSMNSLYGDIMFTRQSYYIIEKITQSGNIVMRTDTGTEALINIENFTKNFSTDLRISSEVYHMSKHRII